MKLDPDYRNRIMKLAEGKISQRVSNGEPAHAAALFEAMFKTAESEICIFSHSLNASVFDVPEVQKSVRKFLANPGTRLRVLLQNPEAIKDRPIARLLSSSLKDNTTHPLVKKATGNYGNKEAKHFAVMDGRAFRFEIHHELKSAVADFNDEEVSKELQSSFEKAFSRGTDIDISHLVH